jgi:predicted aspartyl protease
MHAKSWQIAWTVALSVATLTLSCPLEGLADDTAQTVSAKEDSARHLADQILAAYGGLKTIKEVNAEGFRNIGKVVQYSTLSGAANTFECEVLTKGRKIRIAMEVMGQPLITGFNGENSWTSQGGQVYRTSPLAEKSMKEEIDHGLLLLEDLLEPSTKLALLPSTDVNGKKCEGLSITLKDGPATEFYIDPTTHLVTKSVYTGIDLEQGVPTEKNYFYDDYRSINGMLQPYKVVEYCGTQKASELSIASIVPEEIDDKEFEAPQAMPAAISKGDRITLPFEFVANEILITAKVNGNQTLTFVVDTGATQSILDTAVAKTLGESKDSTFAMTTGAGSIPLKYMSVKDLALDHVVLKDVAFAVTDLSAFSKIIGKMPSGLLGANVLKRFLITIDYEKREITFANPNDAKIKATTQVLAAKPALGLSGLLVDGDLDGLKVPFLVDTGAAFNNISEKLAKPLLTKALLPVGAIQGLDGTKVKIGSIRFDNIKIGTVSVNHPIFSVAPTTKASPAGIISSAGLAILGNPFWSKYTVTIDYENQRVLLDQSAEQLDVEQLAEKFDSLRRKELACPGSENFASRYKDLARTAKSKHVSGIEGLCQARLICLKSLAKSDQQIRVDQLDSEHTSIIKAFEAAEKIASESPNKAFPSRILATAASYYLDNFPRPAGLMLGKDALVKAAALCPTEPAAYVATAKMLAYLSNSNLEEQLIDQALMLDPANWEALKMKYQLAEKQKDRTVKILVLEQFQRYYGDAKFVKELSAQNRAPETKE